MDDGHVIPGLNENWTFAGAKPMEWASGLIAAMIFSELFFGKDMGKGMPLIIGVLIGTPILLATLRKAYPDEEKGLANHVLSVLGLPPAGIPAPSLLQPNWSGLPLDSLPEECEFEQLGLSEIFFPNENEEVPSLEEMLNNR